MTPESSDYTLALVAALPFIGALFPSLMIRAGRAACAMSAGAATLIALILILTRVPAVLAGETVAVSFEWLPQLGLNVSFMLDGLGLLFSLMILGIGLLIILYGRYYLSREDPMGQFFTYLMLFQGAMLGIVLSDNILVLLIFWELTSLSSFLLIGYWRHLPEGRQGARMALTVTGMGGLALIGGMLLLGQAAGTYELSELLTRKEVIQASPLYVPALILILLGAFTKSAQFPFHFWLPRAMAAPTPVSAYLHSATMVKAGLFLMARLWPVLAGTDVWFYAVATTGLFTMVFAALIGIFQNDLKGLLAYSTVSHLGFITMLLGFGTTAAAGAAVLHIINHSVFKAALFMSAGIVDHEAHTRDIRRLGGLMWLMPITATIAFICAFSMAGVPFFNGFLSKEMMLDYASKMSWLGNDWIIFALAAVGATFSVAYSFRFAFHTFGGPVRDDYPAKPHDPGVGMWIGPAFLAALVILIGIFPNTFAGWLHNVASNAVTGGAYGAYKIKLWHGLNAAFIASMSALVVGALIVYFYRPINQWWTSRRDIDAKVIFDRIIAGAVQSTSRLTYLLHDGQITRPLAILSLSTVALGYLGFVGGGFTPGTREMLPLSIVDVVLWLMMMVALAALVIYHRFRLLALVLVGILGLVISLLFVRLSAPDLAMTQISVEVVTIMLMLLALYFLPRQTPQESSTGRQVRDGVVASLGGLGVGALAYLIMTRDFASESISAYHLANSKPGGGGTNVVNVILVDFRGYDTFGEIIVLGIAALLIFALGEALLNGKASRRLANWTSDTAKSADRHPLMMVVATRIAMPIVLLVGVYIFIRGHNEPGGGFISGLVVAIALLMQYMASGFAWAQERQRFPYHSMIGWGVMIAGITGMAAWFAGRPFLSSTFAYYEFPPIEEFELASALAFDLGVFLTVLGGVMLGLYSLSRLARRAGETVNEEAMDYDPSFEARVTNMDGEAR